MKVKDLNPRPDKLLELRDLSRVMELFIRYALTETEQFVILHRFGFDDSEGHTLVELAGYLGMSKSGIEYHEKKALRKLRRCKGIKFLEILREA